MNIRGKGLKGLIILMVITGSLWITLGGWRMFPHFNNMMRHRQVMHGGVPQPYTGQHSSLEVTQESLQQGQTLYRQNCLTCHGAQGHGDGPAAKGLSPRPADLANLVRMPMGRDDYIFWVVSEGGKRYGTAMPAFKTVLSEEDRWKVILFLKNRL